MTSAIDAERPAVPVARTPSRVQAVLLLAALFVATRLLWQLGAGSWLDPDSYKYLSGADSLRAGLGLPPLYTSVAVNGGALHVVPGYAFLIATAWAAAGGIGFACIAAVQSVVAFVGLLALADLVSRWIGTRAALACASAYVLSPSIVLLEQSLTPDSIAAPLLFVAFWLAVTSMPGRSRAARIGGAVACGAVIGSMVLMRTSSQAYVALPWLLVVISRSGWARTLVWTAAFVAGLAAPLAPWIAFNHAHHGVYAVAESRGRNLYFSSVWSGTIDRAGELARYGIRQQPVPRSAYALADAALQLEIARGASLVEADRRLGEIAMAAYHRKSLRELAAERAQMIAALFVRDDDPGAASLTPLRPFAGWYLDNGNASPVVRQMLEKRFEYRFSNEFVQATTELEPLRPRARRAVEWWIATLTFDGIALFASFLVAAVVLMLRAGERTRLAIVLFAPPAAFLAAYAFYGSPIYRYQAGLHPFLLATVACALTMIIAPPAKSPRSRA